MAWILTPSSLSDDPAGSLGWRLAGAMKWRLFLSPTLSHIPSLITFTSSFSVDGLQVATDAHFPITTPPSILHRHTLPKVYHLKSSLMWLNVSNSKPFIQTQERSPYPKIIKGTRIPDTGVWITVVCFIIWSPSQNRELNNIQQENDREKKKRMGVHWVTPLSLGNM